MDLEARVAELEAATARKGNRKVSLTVSGYVTKQIMFWDDGADSNAYISDIGPTQATNFRMLGEAKIAPGWTAGYLMRIQDLSDNSMGLSQVVSRVDQGLAVQMSYWYLASKDLGKVSVGKNALASKSAAMFTDLSGTQVIANYVLFDGGQFFLRRDGQLLKLTWGDFGYCYSQARPWGGDCDGIVMEGVRYDSPTVGGFSFAASFGQDDDWELAGRYSGELAGFRIALGVGYSINTDERLQAQVSRHKRSEFFQAGGYLQHLSTGLFLHAAYGEEDNNGNVILSGLAEPDTHQWYVKGGIRRQWFSPRPYRCLRRNRAVPRPAGACRPQCGCDRKRVCAIWRLVSCRRSMPRPCRCGSSIGNTKSTLPAPTWAASKTSGMSAPGH